MTAQFSYVAKKERKTPIQQLHLFLTWKMCFVSMWICSANKHRGRFFCLGLSISDHLSTRSSQVWWKEGGQLVVEARWNGIETWDKDEMNLAKLAELTELDKLAKLMSYWHWGISQFFFECLRLGCFRQGLKDAKRQLIKKLVMFAHETFCE